ncbi:MAG: hypothetical protein IAE80_11805 [Anaerolinea sp.]|nr:hypothetical protein [Anaerolinea sp.]
MTNRTRITDEIQRFERRFLRQPLYVVLALIYLLVVANTVRLLIDQPLYGKDSEITYFLLILLIAFLVMFVRSVLILVPRFHDRFSTAIPVWEQIMLAINEAVSAGLLAFFGADMLVHIFQPEVFTTRVDVLYALGVGFIIVSYYAGMELMWVQRWNNWFSTSSVWLSLARFYAPLALIVTTLVIIRRLINRADPRTADLLGSSELDLTLLALAPVIWLLIFVLVILAYTSQRGLRERFLPTLLIERLPPRLGRILRSISDMDMLLILAVMATVIPAYLFLIGDRGGILSLLSGRIQAGAGALIENAQQALAVLFTLPFYVLILALLVIYAVAMAQSKLSAAQRDELVNRLPVGFLIIMIITLYLFAIPLTQVLIAGHLPQLPQDLGRILTFNVVIPLLLLYAHYFVFVRVPYGRGQNRWRINYSVTISDQLVGVERDIESLNAQIAALDQSWSGDQRLDTLYRYVQLNSRRDDLNMRRLQYVAERQSLAELSEAPVSLAVARLPIRVVSIGIPLLLAIQIYQWAILNNGLRDIINNPNITVFEFFRALLQQTQF